MMSRMISRLHLSPRISRVRLIAHSDFEVRLIWLVETWAFTTVITISSVDSHLIRLDDHQKFGEGWLRGKEIFSRFSRGS